MTRQAAIARAESALAERAQCTEARRLVGESEWTEEARALMQLDAEADRKALAVLATINAETP